MHKKFLDSHAVQLHLFGMQNTNLQVEHTFLCYIIINSLDYLWPETDNVSAMCNGIAVNDHRLYIYTQTQQLFKSRTTMPMQFVFSAIHITYSYFLLLHK
jgi:hypothetical protein